MEITVLAFGIAKDIFGRESVQISLNNEADIASLKTLLEEQYPKLKELASYMIAVNDEYAHTDTVINPGDEIAIIPPVSGG
ncbi:Molybdopterin synthase sulfur carrier subunit [Methylococcales bacterium]|nr:Molybdopterin synthase sulfur carrier subunit [Methylococcales bacterium]